MARDTREQAIARWSELEALQEHYKEFSDFLYDVINDLTGYKCSAQQEDIAQYLQYGPQYSMIQAQRGQAKTTITGAYAVWCLVHDPTTRVLVLSGGGDLADEVSNWIVSIILNMEELECLRPDPAAGDRCAVSAFDVHYSLKGVDKSPSVACKGVTGQLQGRRADLLIADDIEMKSNSWSDIMREKIKDLTRDFTDICTKGKIVYLGTPQSVDSIYNSLPERGYEVRIWPGRFPTEEEEKNYAGCLAPFILERLDTDPTLRSGGGMTGERGKPTDPALLDEDVLTAKEIDQGAPHFQLQYMLDTRLMDKDRYPLHLNRLVFTPVGERMPIRIEFSPASGNKVVWPHGHPCKQSPIYFASGGSDEFGSFIGTYMYVDPSGGGKNGDELAWAVTKFLGGQIYLLDIGGIPGGLHDGNLKELTEIAKRWRPQRIGVEKNFGSGALVQVWKPMLFRECSCTIEEPWESGQKELRIIDILEPIIGANRLVIDDKLVEIDWVRCQQYPMEVRNTYSLFFQIQRITRERNALSHDDRIDALAGACRPWAALLAADSKRFVEAAKSEEWRKMTSNPLGIPNTTKQKANTYDAFYLKGAHNGASGEESRTRSFYRNSGKSGSGYPRSYRGGNGRTW